MNDNITRSIRELNKQKSDKINLVSGILGIALGGVNTVEVPSRAGYVFVRLRGNMSELIQAYNGAVSPIYDLPVLVTYQNNRYAVYGRDTERYGDWGQSSYLPLHGDQHSFAPDLGLGGDIAWIYSRQFVPLSSVPSGSAGAGNVIVNSHTFLDPTDATWKFIGDEGSPNLLGSKPTGSSARLMLLAWDIVAQDPIFLTGTFFPNSITGTQAIVPFIPSLSNNRLIPISAVRLVSGTDVIGWENIYDLRQFAVSVPPPFVGGVMIQDEGVNKGTGTVLNFVGDNVSVTVAGDTARIYITGSTGGGGSSIDTIGFAGQDEGVNLGTGTVLNAVGAGVTFTRSGTVLRLDIPNAAINTGTLDARYLKLAADNDPVTGNLTINAALNVTGLGDFGSDFFIDGQLNVTKDDNNPENSAIIAYQELNNETVFAGTLNLGRYALDPGDAPSYQAPLMDLYSYDESGTTTEGLLKYDLNGTVRIDLNPSKSGTGTAYLLDTEAALSHQGKLMLLSNAGTPRFWVNASGTAFERGNQLAKQTSANGTFTTTDLKTVTVVNGIITNIS
jgi:hypothetical protein